jgi:methyl-accepting chemotaxis protein
MKLETKIMLAAATAVGLTTALSIGIVHHVSSKNRVAELRGKMSSIIAQSEQVAAGMDDMYRSHAFDTAGLMAAAKAQSQAEGRPLKEMYSSTDIYKTVPIVAAWKSVQSAADKNGFKFFTPARPDLTARNPKNSNGADFAAAFQTFDKGSPEYFLEDRAHDQLILARPVRLQPSCLACHGDPANSRTGDGKDPLGFPMENMKVGDIRGAFVLEAGIGHDAVVGATMKAMAIGGGIVLLAVLAGFYWFNRRIIVRPVIGIISEIEEASRQTSGAASQISDASHSLAEGASEQAAALEQTSASLEEMSSMTKRNAENARKANALAEEARGAADKGAGDMKAMSAAMEAIKVSSDDIAKIIKTIDEIAFQTNILALNAAVEAARAGEAGMGFAVVADEVRNLAARSAQAAKETAAKIEGAISKTGQGVEISSKVLQALNDIVSKVRQVDELVAEVATASHEQTQGITQISTAVSQMDKVTQSNAANAEESASAAEELNAQAEYLEQSVVKMLAFVGGAHHDAATAAPPNTPTPGHFATETAIERHSLQPVQPANSRRQSASIPMPAPVKAKTQNGVIAWDDARMSTGDDTIDSQHKSLIEHINDLHAACLAGTGREELLKMLAFLGEYAQSHFRHEEEVMQNHRCPSRGKNKAAHVQFLHDYTSLVEAVNQHGPSTTVILQIKELLGNWLQNHICSVDTGLRTCTANHQLQSADSKTFPA